MELDTKSLLHDIRNMTYEERVKHLQTLVKNIEKQLESLSNDLQSEDPFAYGIHSKTLNTLYGQNRLCVIEAIHDELHRLVSRPLNDTL